MYDASAAARSQPSARPAPVPKQADTLPSLTLLLSVDETSVDVLRNTWRTWMLHRRQLRDVPIVAIYDDSLDPESLAFLTAHQPATLVPWYANPNDDCDRQWSAGMLRVAAEHVTTPWYLRLEPPEAIALRKSLWFSQEWFEPAGDGPPPVYVAPRWGYSKPADVFRQLDDWGDEVPGLKEFPRLNWSFDPKSDRIQHPAISTWCWFVRTDWSREILGYLGDDGLPCESLATYAAYCAARREDPTLRVNMKALGWDHSFATQDKIARTCELILH